MDRGLLKIEKLKPINETKRLYEAGVQLKDI